MGGVHPSDADLLRRARDGDVDAFGALVERNQDYLHNAVCHLVGRTQDAEDIAQDVFVKAFAALSGFEGKARFSTWLYGIMLNTVRNFWRQSKSRQTFSLAGDRSGEHLPQEPEAGRDTPLAATLREERINAVRGAIADLDEELREILVLRDIRGFHYDELVEIVGVPAGTVKRRLHRARMALKGKLTAFHTGRTETERSD